MELKGVKITVNHNQDGLVYHIPVGMTSKVFKTWLKRNAAALHQFKIDEGLIEE